MAKENIKVSLVVVTYKPEDDVEAFFYEQFSKNGMQVIIVDNTPREDWNDFAFSRCNVEPCQNLMYINMNGNKGIAAALNSGAEYAFKHWGSDYVFFFDQDSKPKYQDMQKLLSFFISNEGGAEPPLAMCGPAYYDTRLQRVAPFIKFSKLFMRRIDPKANSIIEVDYIITSGSLVSSLAWSMIGRYDESLFIDYVDIEWCLRAKSLGWRVVGIPSVIMEHTLGEEPINVFGKKLPVHSPLRHYYFFRNCIALLRRDYIPIAFKLREFCFLPVRFFVYSIFTKEKRSHISKMCQGVIDGVLSKTGPY
ncbi:glycosyltransferase family 2 protein [Aeromonas veronii]